MAINPSPIGNLLAQPAGSLDLARITFNTTSSNLSLSYELDESLAPQLFLDYLYAPNAAVAGRCVVGGALAAGSWNAVHLEVALSTGVATAIINGTRTTCGNTGPGPEMSATLTLGLRTTPSTTDTSSAYYDNIIVTARR